MIALNIVRTDEHFWEMDKLDLPDIPAVYFIYNARCEMIYIGQTRHLLKRTVDHFHQDLWFKTFAQYIAYIETAPEDLREDEWWFIQEHRPKFNFEHYPVASDGDMRSAVREKPII